MNPTVRKVLKISRNVLLGVLGLVAVVGVALAALLSSRTVTVPEINRATPTAGSYPIVGTGQSTFWDASGSETAAPAKGAAFYGQDAQSPGTAASYRDNGDGTVSDLVTGLMWTQTTDLNGDGTINADDKLTLSEAVASVDSVSTGGYSDWRLPSIKEMYSLINFNGVDPMLGDTDTSRLKPFIDTNYFGFGYGDVNAGNRNIDAQVVTSSIYTSKTFFVLQTMFGVNFADGRIKGYPPSIGMGAFSGSFSANKFYVYYVRGNSAYGVNDFQDNGDGTVTDAATKLTWSQTDSKVGMDWEHALAWVQKKNAANYLGHNDWRLPNVKELQSIVDYSRSPSATNSAAIDPVFSSTSLTNEGGTSDYGAYWSSTTHVAAGREMGSEAAYVCFGRCMGKMFGLWMDVHGAGAQRSDPKVGDASAYSSGRGPQGDAIRISNFVRLVRGGR